MINSIVLLNGNILRCYPRQNYVQPFHWYLSREAIRANKRLFYLNVYNFIANADKILGSTQNRGDKKERKV